MTRVIIPDVRAEPWSTDATIIVDVSSLTHWIRDDVRGRARSAHRTSGAGTRPPGASLRTAARGLHRLVDLFEHHGVTTRRLVLGTTLGPFPLPSSGWVPREPAEGEPEDPAGWKRRRAIEDGERIVANVTAALAARGIAVESLPGLFGAAGEHCVDELCVLAAAHASWSTEGGDVIVVSRDADVAVAPLLTGGRRILLARPMSSENAKELGERRARHGEETVHDPPSHLRLLALAMRGLLQPEDLPDGPLRHTLASAAPEPVPPVELVEVDGHRILRNAWNADQVLSSPLEVEPDRSWLERRRPLLERGVRATAVVDPFGLLAAANRSDVPGRIPLAASVAEALEPLALPLPLGQLAVVPDLLDTDHGLIAVAEQVDGVALVPLMHEVLTERVKRGLLDLDEDIEAALDSYTKDDLPETVATPSQFARGPLTEIADSPAALEEKESAVLLAADLLWALMHTEGPVVLLSERPDLVVLLDLMDDHFGPALRMRERVVRVGLHGDPFSGEEIAVDRSGTATRWPAVLLTGRMIADLLRIGEDGPATDEDGAIHVAEAVGYDPTAGAFTVHDLDGRRLGEVTLADIVQFPVKDVRLMRRTGQRGTAQLRAALMRHLRLHLDLRRPLPRPRLVRDGGEAGEKFVSASVLSARVIGHREDGSVSVRVTSSDRQNEVLHASGPSLAALPEVGRDVEVVLEDDGERCRLSIPDLTDVPDHVGRPRPARMLEDGRAVLLTPLDPTDVRDDTGEEVTVRRLLGPYPQPQPDDIVLVTAIDAGVVQVVSTPLGWVDAVRR